MSFSSIIDRISGPKPSPASGLGGILPGAKAIVGEGYNTIPSNWYTAKPYGFKLTMRDGKQSVFFLPIAPSNLNITTQFATNVIPTLYGTVEEHSEIRYYDITISGTTGIAPKYVSEFSSGNAAAAAADSIVRSQGRSAYKIDGSVQLGGFFSKTLGIANQILTKASDIVNGQPKPKTGVYTEQSGYMAFHNFYRFFLKYKQDAAGGAGVDKRTKHPLTFFNYKDNNEYSVAIRQFVLTRSADNPMLYNYQITMRAYNLRSVGDQVTDGDLTNRLKELGLDGVDSSSLLGDIKKLSSDVKSVIGSAVAGIKVLGR